MLKRLLRALFGSPSSETTPSTTVDPIEHEGFLIYPEPQREGGQYRVAGRICKSIGGELKSHHFIRSDLCGSPEQANELMVEKAKNFIRHVQDEMFNPPRP